MDRTDRRALVLALVDALRASGSWCGETHVQKSCYILQRLVGLPTNFEFILYKHGPFSFDLQEYFHSLRGDDLIAAAPTGYRYGTSLLVTEHGKKIEQLRSDLIAKYAAQFKKVSDRLGPKSVRDLEKIATAVYVTDELGPDKSVEERAKKITEYKKHVSFKEATQAVEEFESIAKELVS